MSTILTFDTGKILNTSIVDADGSVHYTATTTSGFRGRKVTTILAASGTEGVINWREKLFIINGVPRSWADLKARTGGMFNTEREWRWDQKSYKLKYDFAEKELMVTPSSGSPVRFTPHRAYLFNIRETKPAAIYFPSEMQDANEKMFLLMAVLKTEIQRQDTNEAAAAAAA
ncbi:hypothetical protein C8R43DRAFT_986327 [Mycena crocata]|nr:hypothetical protein C8R43DRAFT_986327 [Mycena crocata]